MTESAATRTLTEQAVSPTPEATQAWPRRLETIAYGGDYNPEQWDERTWREDVRLMREAGVNLVSLGIFSWALLEPAQGRYDFSWLDRVVDLLSENGVHIDLATPTAAPPAWLLRREPAVRPVNREGVRLAGGSRQTFCPSSPAYAAAAAGIADALGEHYQDHPGLEMWHVHNEFGAHMPACYCDTCAAGFRSWLERRYSSLQALNQAWGTAFWGQWYYAWDEIESPRLSTAVVNPTQQLDYHRFMSDTYLQCFIRERDALRRWTPDVPITTNFMASTCKTIDYWRWAREVDIVSNDHYLRGEEPDNHIGLALAADLTRSLAGGKPWLLMEHSTSAVNWQPRNIAKRPREMLRNSLAHVARGADGVMFFQWRASARGAEKFHSAMVPHGGARGRVWDEVVELGSRLGGLSALRGSQVQADVAILWDWESYWAIELEWRPSADLRHLDQIRAYYERLWRANVTADFAHPEADLSNYRMVVAPTVYLLTSAAADNLRGFVADGGCLVTTYFSGIVDQDDAVHDGGYPGALRDLLGLRVEEFLPLRHAETVRLDGGGTGRVWAEAIETDTADVVQRYTDGPNPGGPAVTRNEFGRGPAWYVSTQLDGEHLDEIIDAALRDAGIAPRRLGDVEVIRRTRADGECFATVINHGESAVAVPVTGTDVLTGDSHLDGAVITGEEVLVLREHLPPQKG